MKATQKRGRTQASHGKLDTGNAIRTYLTKDDGTFPNSALPVLHYIKVLKLPILFASLKVRRQFAKNGWTNSWTAGVFTYHHYHSNTHEVLGIIKGETTIRLGGRKGVKITVSKGDVVIIPAGVAHKNLGKEKAVTCVGAYPGGKDYNMNYGKAGERPAADELIAAVTIPQRDPIFGLKKGIPEFWDGPKGEKLKSSRGAARPKRRTRSDRKKVS
jgi:uncharacterized protein YjlB